MRRRRHRHGRRLGHRRLAGIEATPQQVASALPDHRQIFDTPDDVVTNRDLQPGEKAKILQEWELEARLMDVAIDEGMTKKGEDGSNKVAAKSLLPEVKKAQQDLDAKPIPDEGAPTRFTP
jgi:hypothetical protein